MMKERTITTRFNSEEAEHLDSIITNSYSDFVRLERRNLVAASCVMLLAYFGNASPSNVNLPFIKLPNLNITMLFTALLLTCLYFLLAFIIYAYPGYRESKKNWEELTSETFQITSNFRWYHIEKDVFLSTSRFYIWLFFNYLLPVAMGLLALFFGACKII